MSDAKLDDLSYRREMVSRLTFWMNYLDESMTHEDKTRENCAV